MNTEPWITTITGRFFPLAPRADDVHMFDIGASLGNSCRFRGLTYVFYSIAQHSVHVADALRAISVRMALLGLIHDAPEAYLSDHVKPIKSRIAYTMKQLPEVLGIFECTQMINASDAEDAIAEKIYAKLEISPPTEAEHQIIKQSDMRVFSTEVRDILCDDMQGWEHKPIVAPAPQRIRAWQPYDARGVFLDTFEELYTAYRKL
jgi:uncharacterized protein